MFHKKNYNSNTPKPYKKSQVTPQAKALYDALKKEGPKQN
jgi:hypothetical protein